MSSRDSLHVSGLSGFCPKRLLVIKTSLFGFPEITVSQFVSTSRKISPVTVRLGGAVLAVLKPRLAEQPVTHYCGK